jgi:hypothetical protein
MATKVTGWMPTVGGRVAAFVRAAVRPLWPMRATALLLEPVLFARWAETGPPVMVASFVCVERRPPRGPPHGGGVAFMAPARRQPSLVG